MKTALFKAHTLGKKTLLKLDSHQQKQNQKPTMMDVRGYEDAPSCCHSGIRKGQVGSQGFHSFLVVSYCILHTVSVKTTYRPWTSMSTLKHWGTLPTLWYVVSGDLGENQDSGDMATSTVVVMEITSRMPISTQQSWGTSPLWGVSGGWVRNLGLNFHFVSRTACPTFLWQKQCQTKPVKRELFHKMQSPTI